MTSYLLDICIHPLGLRFYPPLNLSRGLSEVGHTREKQFHGPSPFHNRRMSEEKTGCGLRGPNNSGKIKTETKPETEPQTKRPEILST